MNQHTPGTTHARRRRRAAAGALLLCLPWASAADVPVTTVVADFEDSTISASIQDASNTPIGDCAAGYAANPARGQFSLSITLGAGAGGSAATCAIQFQSPILFSKAERIGAAAWVNEGEAELGFRLRDANGELFETPLLPARQRRRWNPLSSSLSGAELRWVPPSPDAKGEKHAVFPIELVALRVATKSAARQIVYIDDIYVDHPAAENAIVQARFAFDRPTHLYAPGETAAASLTLENTSRTIALKQLSVELTWLRADGSELARSRQGVNLPASGADYRTRQMVEVRQKIDETGLFRLIASVTSPGWKSPATFETTIAFTPSNRSLPRGRSLFFGARTNLLGESSEDQQLEIDVAREIGVQLLAVETPWSRLEPRPGAYDFSMLDSVRDKIVSRDIAFMVILTEPPAWIAEGDGAGARERQTAVLEAIAKHHGRRLTAIQPLAEPPSPEATSFVAALRKRFADEKVTAEVWPGPYVLGAPGESTPYQREGAIFHFVETGGDPQRGIAALERFRDQHKIKWGPSDVWMHALPPTGAAGYLADSVDVLRYMLRAAAAGVRTVLWADLRDDAADARYPEKMRGLVRRDYSPKTSLLGYANAVGMMSGLVYKGPVEGAPQGVESAMFVANERQVAVFAPHAGSIPPLAMIPVQGVDGRLEVFDFERRRQTPLDGATGLYRPLERPYFIQLLPSQTRETVQISLDKAWVRGPSSIACDRSAKLHIEIDALPSLGLKYVQLTLPPRSPLKSAFSARDLKSEPGKTVRPSTSPTPDASRKIGALTAADRQVRTRLDLFASYQPQELHILAELPTPSAPGAELRVGVCAGEPALVHEFAISLTGETPTARSIVAHRVLPAGLRCSRIAGAKPMVLIEMPAAALGFSQLKPGNIMRLAVQVVIPPGGATPASNMRFGPAVDGSRAVQSYEQLILAE
ncbi:MAG: beta-galactosidase [Planctomycetes bacterium]|nr:beta-galactosidase [Planctomycetota bacterium]